MGLTGMAGDWRGVTPAHVCTEVTVVAVRPEVHPGVVRGGVLRRPSERSTLGTPGVVIWAVEDRLCLLVETVEV